MKYETVKEATFLSRPNRFIATVLLDGAIETVHVKNTGRCKELLVPGAKVFLSKEEDPRRKTKYDLIAVEKTTPRGAILINMDSQAPNSAVREWLCFGGLFSEKAEVRREVCFGSSRFDLFAREGDRRAWIEVKGVTLERDGTVLFPDAPTQRGRKHLQELMQAVDLGYEAYLIFVVQMKGVTSFSPNANTDPGFAEALRRASDHGVRVLAYDCKVKPDEMRIDRPIPVVL